MPFFSSFFAYFTLLPWLSISFLLKLYRVWKIFFDISSSIYFRNPGITVYSLFFYKQSRLPAAAARKAFVSLLIMRLPTMTYANLFFVPLLTCHCSAARRCLSLSCASRLIFLNFHAAWIFMAALCISGGIWTTDERWQVAEVESGIGDKWQWWQVSAVASGDSGK